MYIFGRFGGGMMSEDKKKLLGEVLLDNHVIETTDADEALSENHEKRMLLGRVLVDKNIVTEKDLNEALEEQRRSSRRLGDILIARGLATQKDILDAFSLQIHHRLETDMEPVVPSSYFNRITEIRIPIRIKLALFITALIVFIMTVASYFFYSSQKEEFIVQTMRFGTAIAGNLSHNASVPLLENDEASLNILLEEVSKLQDVHYALAINKAGLVIAHSDIQKIDRIYAPIANPTQITRNDSTEIIRYREKGKEILDFSTPIKFDNITLGAIHIAISLETLQKKIQRFGIIALLLTGVLVIIGVGVSFYISSNFSQPITDLVHGTVEIKQGNFSFRSEKRSNDELGDLTLAFKDMAEGLRKKEVIQDAFGKYVNPEIVNMILKNPDSQWFHGKKIPATVMFTDIRGFTAFSEKTSPEQVVAVLNNHFTIATEIIIKHGGHLDKFIGDAVLAVFGVLLEYDDHAERAVRAAVDLQQALHKERTEQNQNSTGIHIGIGINSGEVIAGNIGSQQRMEYTVIGDTVNIASRLTEIAGSDEIILSESTYRLSEKMITTKKLEPVTVKGKNEPLAIYLVADGIQEG